MSTSFRVILIVVCICTAIFVLFRIRKSQVQIKDTLFWVGFIGILLLVSIFPRLAEASAELLGIASAINFVFLSVIFLLLIKLFTLSMQVSRLENKIKTLAQIEAIRSFDHALLPNPEAETLSATMEQQDAEHPPINESKS